MKKAIITILLLLFGTIAHAADWYVDNAVPSSGNGQSWASAWKIFSDINWAGMTSGDTLYISGGTSGKTYNTTLIVAAGTSGITIRPGGASLSPTGHQGLVTIATGNPYCIRVTSYGTPTSNITVNGNVNGARKIKVDNCDRGVESEGAVTNTTVSYLEVTGTTYGVYFNGASGTINNCYIHNLRSNAESGIQGSFSGIRNYFDNLIVHNNIIEVPISGGLGADGILGASLTVYNNIIKAIIGTYTGSQHDDAIQCLGNYCRAYSNIVSGFRNYGFYYEGCSNYCYAYNNYFYDTRGPFAIGGGAKNEIRVDNNTIIDSPSDTPVVDIVFNNTAQTLRNASFRNNIVVGAGSAVSIGDTWAPSSKTQGDFNCGIDIIIDANVINGYNSSISCKNSPPSQPTYSSSSLPNFVSYTAGGGASNDVHLTSGDTIAKNKGVSLSSYLSKYGLPGPQGAEWDIGANKYGPNTLSSPSNFRKQ